MCWTCWTAFSKSTRLYSNPSHNHFCYKNILQPFIQNMAQYGILIDLEPESFQNDFVPVPVQESTQNDFVPVQDSTQNESVPVQDSTQNESVPVRDSTQNYSILVRESNDFPKKSFLDSAQKDFRSSSDTAQHGFHSSLDPAQKDIHSFLVSGQKDIHSFLNSAQKDIHSFLSSAQKDFRSFFDSNQYNLGLQSNLLEDHSCSALDLAIQSISNEKYPTIRPVATWACTKLAQTFQGKHWAITSKIHGDIVADATDFSVGRVQNGKINPYLAMEIRPNRIDCYFSSALHEAMHKVQKAMSKKDKIFLVIQCGLRIGFFEYHNNKQKLYKDDFPNYHGCIPLTMDSTNGGGRLNVILDRKPEGLLPILHHFKGGRGRSNGYYAANFGVNVGQGANVPCVFHLTNHEKEIDFLFHYMATEKPREIDWSFI